MKKATVAKRWLGGLVTVAAGLLLALTATVLLSPPVSSVECSCPPPSPGLVVRPRARRLSRSSALPRSLNRRVVPGHREESQLLAPSATLTSRRLLRNVITPGARGQEAVPRARKARAKGPGCPGTIGVCPVGVLPWRGVAQRRIVALVGRSGGWLAANAPTGSG